MKGSVSVRGIGKRTAILHYHVTHRDLSRGARRIGRRYFDVTGVPLSSAATVVERFTPNAECTNLNYTTAVTDPETFTEQVELKSTRAWRPGDHVKTYNCTTSTRASVKS